MKARSPKRWYAVVATAASVSVLSACGGGSSSTDGSSSAAEGSDGDVVIEFQQWWEPELPDGALRGLMDQFEEENPGITVELLSGPYSSTKEQVVAGAAAGTMADVVGLDGAWVYDFVQQGSIANLTELMTQQGYDDSELASQIQIDGATYMIPVVNYVYPLFVNNDLLEQAGVESVPTTRSEFEDAAVKITENTDAAGWVLPLSLETPNGIQNDVMSWVWASGGSMLKDGQPDLLNDQVASATEFIQRLWDEGVIAEGAFNLKEQDKVEEFTNGRVGMMISSLAHINTIREANPDLDFSVAAVPAEDGYTGERGIPYASWGIGVAANSENQDAAWKLVEFLMSADVNSELSTVANAFPGNTESTPDFSDSDPLFEEAFEIYQAGYPANEFVGLPVAEELMRMFSQEFQKALEGDETMQQALENVQPEWEAEFK